MWKIWFKSS